MNHRNKEQAQGLVEYALIIALMAIVVIVALNFLASGITGAMYNNIIGNL